MKRLLIFITVLASLSGCAKVGEIYRSFFPGKSEKKAEEKAPDKEPEAKGVTRLTGKDAGTTEQPEAKSSADTKKEVTVQKAPVKKSEPVKTVKPVTVKKPEEKKEEEKKEPVKVVYRYNPKGKRDPFLLPGVTAAGEKKSISVADLKAEKGSEIDFSKFQLKATLNLNGWTATLEDSTGKGVILRIGDVFGGAKVVSITKDTITLRRIRILSEGQERDVVLKKADIEGGK